MTYIVRNQIKESLQKDLYIKKKLNVSVSQTPWIPKVNITLKKIVCDLKDTALGSGNTIIRIYKNYGQASQDTIFDIVFAQNEVTQETNSIFSYSINAGDEINYGVVSVTDADPGGEAIISFIYENT